jgi:hypothetical protein
MNANFDLLLGLLVFSLVIFVLLHLLPLLCRIFLWLLSLGLLVGLCVLALVILVAVVRLFLP